MPSQGRGREFESPTVHSLLQPLRGRLAQLEERCLHTAEVTGSSPVSPTRKVKELDTIPTSITVITVGVAMYSSQKAASG